MKELRLVLLGLAAVIAVMLGAGLVSRALERKQAATAMAAKVGTSTPAAVVEPVSLTTTPGRARIEAVIALSPDYTKFFEQLRRIFPAEYATILDTLAANQKQSDSVDLIMANAVSALRHSRGSYATKASDTALSQIFSFQLREMQALAARDPHLCVAFLYGANGSGFLSFAGEHRQLVADAALAGLDAMNDGKQQKIVRGTPSESDFQALDHALMQKNLSRPEIDALLDGKDADPPIADNDMCHAGITYLETLASMPVETRDRLYGLAIDLMARS